MTTSRPRIAAGSKPTAQKIENRPPTPSGMSKISLQPSSLASLSSLLFFLPVTGITRSSTLAPFAPGDLRCSSSNKRKATAVSMVSPLLLMTTTPQRRLVAKGGLPSPRALVLAFAQPI